MALGNAYPVRTTVAADRTDVQGVWTGGGAAADCTKASGDWNAGIASVKYNGATGKYRITFNDVGTAVIHWSINIARVTGVTNDLAAKMVAGSLNITNKTLDFEVSDLAVPTGTDLALTDKIYICISFARRNT